MRDVQRTYYQNRTRTHNRIANDRIPVLFRRQFFQRDPVWAETTTERLYALPTFLCVYVR
jgi:hypothetical protein